MLWKWRQVDTKKAKAKIDKDAVIRELNGLIDTLRREMGEKNNLIAALRAKCDDYENCGNVDDVKTQEMVFEKVDALQQQLDEAEQEEAKWTVHDDEMIHSEAPTLSEHEMKAVFSQFDEDGDGSMIAQELQQCLKSMDRDLTEHDVAHLMHSTNMSIGGEIGFDEFTVMVGRIKSRFVDSFECKLAESMGRALEKMDIASTDGDSQSDDDDDDDDDDDKSWVSLWWHAKMWRHGLTCESDC